MFEKSIYPEFFNKIAQELYAEQVSAFSKLFENKRFYDAVMEEVGREAYKDLRKDASPGLTHALPTIQKKSLLALFCCVHFIEQARTKLPL